MKYIAKSIGLFVLLVSTAHAKDVLITVGEGATLMGELNNEKATLAVLLLHQCNRNQSMWRPLTAKLTTNEFSSLTVDFRGFGQSKSPQFDVDRSDKDYLIATQRMQNDVTAIYHYWKQLTPNAKTRILVGASCGGGAAAILTTKFDDINALVLLSPSLRDYWFPVDYWPTLNAKQALPILAIASKQDKNALNAIDRVTAESQSPLTEYIRYNGKLHGEPLFHHDDNLSEKIVRWIVRVNHRLMANGH